VKKLFLLLLCLLLALPCAAQSGFVAGWPKFAGPVVYGDKTYARVLAVGDIHGQFSRFRSMWAKVGVNDDDLVIFLGDYIEGSKTGEDLKTVLWLMEQSARPNVVLLSGNKEREFLRECFDERGNYRPGGKWGLNAELAAAGAPQLAARVRDFFASLEFCLPLEIGGRRFVFAHAGIKDGVPLNEQTEFDLMFCKTFCREYNGAAFAVIGHRPVQSEFGKDHTVPVKVPGRSVLMVDTNCKRKKGFSSCVNVLSGQFWQSGKDWE